MDFTFIVLKGLPMARCFYLITLRNHKGRLFFLRRDSGSQVPSPLQTSIHAGQHVGFVQVKHIYHVLDGTRLTHGVGGWETGDYVMAVSNRAEKNLHDIDVGTNYPAVSKYLRSTGWEVMP